MHKKKHEMIWIMVISVIVGTLLFLFLYGPAPLNVTYDAWLRGSDDISQHYLGWIAFRNAKWMFPLGLHDAITYPYPISIVYTDSIPVFAVFFKMLSPILPQTFQYFGIFILCSFILQAFFSIMLVRRVTDSVWHYVAAAVLFVMAPVMLFRCFIHSALSAHFLLLMAYCIWAYEKELGFRKELVLWIVLGVFSVSIHLYFVPMVGLILTARILDGLLRKDWKTLSYMFGLAAGVFGMAYLLGIFFSGSSGSSWGLGYYNANLNALFNSQGMSHLVKVLPFIPGQEEGFAYLGLGVIILLIMAMIIQIRNVINKKVNWKRFAVCAVLVLITFVLAMSVNVTWNDYQLLSISLPELLFRILSIFRSSGRFLWIIIYGIMIYTLYMIIRNTKKWGTGLIVACVILQCVDLGTFYQRRVSVQPYSTTELDEFFQEAAEDNAHVAMINNINYYATMGLRDDLFEITWQAVKNDMTMNKFLCSRGEDLVATWNQEAEQMAEALREGTADKNTIYVFTKQYVWNEEFPNLNLYEVEGYIIGTYQEYNAASYSLPKEYFEIDLEKDFCIMNGYDSDEGRILHEDGISYGPYMTLESGDYRVVIIGQNLEHCFYTVTPDVTILEGRQGNSRIEYVFSLNQKRENIEFFINNTGTEDVIIESLVLYKD